MPANLHNRDYLEVSGTYTGSTDKDFRVIISGSDGNEQWTYQTKTETTTWTGAPSPIDIVVDSDITLVDGVHIKFTRPSKNRYTADDTWMWSCYKDLKLSDTTSQYDYIETINIEGSNNLIAISRSTGNTSVINNIDSDTPSLDVDTPNIGGVTEDTIIDIEKKNKELYISKGKNSPPIWLGYTKSGGWEGEGPLELRAEKALDIIESSDNPESEAFDKSITLRAGGGANSEDCKVIVGINTESDRADNIVFIMNIDDDKLLKFPTNSAPIMIRKWYGANTGSSDYYCDGFAVMREGEQPEYACTIDLWKLNSGDGTFEGQAANMYSTFHVTKPETSYTEGHVGSFGDFLIVPKLADFSSVDQRYTLVFARFRSRTNNFSMAKVQNYNWLWRTDEKTLAQFEDYNASVIAKDDLEPITPKTEFPNSTVTLASKPKAEWYYLARYPKPLDTDDGINFFSIHTSLLTNDPTYRQYIVDNPDLHSLEFGGWDTDGANPIIGFTAKLRNVSEPGEFNRIRCFPFIDKVISSDQKTLWNDTTNAFLVDSAGPFLSDGAGNITQQRFHIVRWVTWFMAISDTNTGRAKEKMLLHTWDYDADTVSNNDKIEQSTGWTPPEWLSNSHMGTNTHVGLFDSANIPTKNPLFGLKGRYICSGKEDGTRRYLSYIRGGNRKAYIFRFGEETAMPLQLDIVAAPNIFPNSWAGDVTGTDTNALTRWNNVNQSESYPFTALSSEISVLKKTAITASSADDRLSYRLSEGPFQIDQNGFAWWPKAEEKLFIMSVPFRSHFTRQLFKARMDGGATTTNEFTAGNATFLLDTPVATGSDGDWAGPAMKKAFYKASFVYDGYQESALVSATTSIYESDGLKKTYNVKIKVKDTFVLPTRITGIALYRAISTQGDTTEPESLYRFIIEIPILQFSHDDSNGWWHYTVNDTGDAEGTYEAINGMSEKIYNLHINYGINTQQNGYMFIGNCKHNEVEDAENYIFRSQPGKYSLFDWSKDFIHLPFVPVAMKGFMGKLYVFSETQLAVINPENLYIEDIVEGTGCIGPKSIMVTDTGMLWADYKQIYRAAPAIQPIGDNILNVDTYGWLNLSNDVKKEMKSGYDSKRKAYLIFFTSGSDYRCWSYSTTKGRWDLWETPTKVMDTSQTKDGACILLLDDNRIAKYLADTTDSLDWEWESKRLSLGNTMLNKKIRNMKVEGNSRPKIDLTYKVPENYSSWQTGTDISSSHTGSNNTAIKIATADKGKLHWLKLKLTGDNGVSGADIKAYATSVIFKSKRPK